MTPYFFIAEGALTAGEITGIFYLLVIIKYYKFTSRYKQPWVRYKSKLHDGRCSQYF